MKPSLKVVLLTVLLILITFATFSRSGQIIYAQGSDDLILEHLTTADGLSHNWITAILQDEQGFMWFATEEGLNRYDGYDFKIYKHSPTDVTSLSRSHINTLIQDKTDPNIFWVGTENGLNKFDRRTETFTRYLNDPDNPNSISANLIRVLYQDDEGNLWIGTIDGGLNKLDPATETFTHYYNPDTPSNLNDGVGAIYPDAGGKLWLRTLAGLRKFDPVTGQFTPLFDLPAGSHRSFFALDSTSEFWLLDARNELAVFDPATETLTPNPIPDFPSQLRLYTVYQDQQGIIWLGPDEGLYRFDPADQSLSHYLHDPSQPTSLSGNKITYIYEDQDGILWIGTNKGVNKFTPQRLLFQTDYPPADETDGAVVNALYEDVHGILWLGTYNGLVRFDPDSGEYTRYLPDPHTPGSIGHARVLSICADPQGYLWLGFIGGGLNRFDPTTEIFTHYMPDPSVDHVYCDDDQLWLGHWNEETGQGLSRFDLASETFTYYHQLPDSALRIEKITKDAAGMLWIASFDGLYKFDPTTETFTYYAADLNNPNSLAASYVMDIHIDEQGILWLGTSGGGLNRFDPQTETFHIYTDKKGLPHLYASSILPDDAGNLWLAGASHLTKFNPRTAEFATYNIYDGVDVGGFRPASQFKGRDGRLYFGGSTGFVSFYPDQIQVEFSPPPVYLTEFRLFNKPVKAGLGLLLTDPIEQSEHVTLSYQDNVFSFEFTALSYFNSVLNRYAYRLKGFHDDWIEVDSAERRAGFAGLPPGDYTLQVKGSNSDGVWNEEGVSLNITITPPWWETTWFRGLMLMLVVGLIYGGFLWQRRNSRIREQQLEKEVTERTDELAIFFDLARLADGEQNLPDILNPVVIRMLEVSHCRAICVHLLDQDTVTLKLVAQYNLPDAARQQLQVITVQDDFSGWINQHSEPIVTTELAKLALLPPPLRLDDFQTYLGLQLQAGGRFQGWLSCYRASERGFALNEISLLTALTRQVAIIIENQRLGQHLGEMAVLEERQRLARDLHDSVTQSLYSLTLFSRSGQEAMEDGDTTRLANSLADLETTARQSLREMRLLVYELRPLILAQKGLAQALNIRFDTVERRANIIVEFQMDEGLNVPQAVETELYYIVIEALNNIQKHAGASQVSVSLTSSDSGLELQIVDDGCGFDSVQEYSGLGLKSMRQRAERLAAKLDISSTPGVGTKIVLLL